MLGRESLLFNAPAHAETCQSLLWAIRRKSLTLQVLHFATKNFARLAKAREFWGDRSSSHFSERIENRPKHQVHELKRTQKTPSHHRSRQAPGRSPRSGRSPGWSRNWAVTTGRGDEDETRRDWGLARSKQCGPLGRRLSRLKDLGSKSGVMLHLPFGPRV